MRILLGVHAFPPRATAGVEVYTLRLAKALSALGHEVLVLSAVHDLSAEPGALRRRVHEGVAVAEVVNVHHRGTLEATYDDPDVDRAGAEVFAEFQPDVLHLQHLLNLSIGLVELAGRRGTPVILTLHDYWLSCPRDGQRRRADGVVCATVDHALCGKCLSDSPYLVPALQRGVAGALRRIGAGRLLHRVHDSQPGATEAVLRWARRGAGPAADLAFAMDVRAEKLRAAVEGIGLLIAPTRFMRDRTLASGVPGGKVRVVSYGVVAAPTVARRPGPRPRVGFVGTLAPHKGVDVLVEAVRRVADLDCTLDVFGSLSVQPAYVEGLRRAAGSDPRIRFRGAFAEGEQARILRELDVLAVPSVWWENSPLTTLEALGAGVPVVASRIGGVPELIEDGRSGRLVPPGDPAALAGALRAVVTGRDLGDALPPLPLKTVEAGARELVAFYADAARQRDA
jgi:glycosyltransferase involved in cell wall biosynthesis